MDKSTRDRDQGENLAAYVENLRVRAKEFGIVRNEQAIKAKVNAVMRPSTTFNTLLATV